MLDSKPEKRIEAFEISERKEYIARSYTRIEDEFSTELFQFTADDLPEKFHSLSNFNGKAGSADWLKHSFNWLGPFIIRLKGIDYTIIDLKQPSFKAIRYTDETGSICNYYGFINAEKQPHQFGIWIREDGYKVEIGEF